MSILDDVDKIIYESFGLSNYLFFSSVRGYSKNTDFREIREDFFKVLRYLLETKKIILVMPDADIYRTPTHIPKFTIHDKEVQWKVKHEDAVQYFRERWPQNISNLNDINLVCYLYEMPGIIWIANDGSLHSS